MNTLLNLAKNLHHYARVVCRLTLVLLIAGLVGPIVTQQSALPADESHHTALFLDDVALAASTARSATPMVAVTHTVYLPVVTRLGNIVGTGKDWAMAAANPQRTSWTLERVADSSQASLGNLRLEWYLPIEAYIPQNVQVIAANGLLYISTAKGLYALQLDTGEVAWRFDTELPLGNSPTVADGVVYVGGYDRKLHALDASNGTVLWSFDGAQAGYDTNPLVVEGKVLLGNRDGAFYAIGAQGTPQQGQLVWKYQTGGSIDYSAAYKYGVVYFAANDNYAYALNISDGSLVWKSDKLIGDGYYSYWPVVYTDPSTQSDYVIFSISSGYRNAASPGTRSLLCRSWDPNDPNLYPCESFYLYETDLFFDSSPTLGPTVPINEPWTLGRTVVDYSRVIDYYENNPNADPHFHKPWRRFYLILNATNGTEYTFDSNHNGYSEYAPVVPYGTTSGNYYPPVVGKDGLLYFSNRYEGNGQGRIMGWKMGTPYFVLGRGQGATDEPQAISAGDDLIYRNLCCDRTGDWFDITSPNTSGTLWGYSSHLDDQAPGYDQMWWFIDPNIYSRLHGNYGGVNGIYHNHGDQSPIIPYQGHLITHRSNAVIVYGPGPSLGRLPLLAANRTKRDALVLPTKTELIGKLEGEIQKILAAGHLRPGYYNGGQFQNAYPELSDYFANPGDTLYTLSIVYPHLSSTVQQQVRTYLQNEFRTYFDPAMYTRIGWAEGGARESFPLPKEVQDDLVNHPRDYYAGRWAWQYPQYNFYALYKYAQVVPGDTARAYELAKSKLQVPVPSGVPGEPIDVWFARRPYEQNAWIVGYIGFLKLQELAHKTTDDSQLRTLVTNELNRLLQQRADTFSKDTYYSTYATCYQNNGWFGFRSLNVARNFILLVPELGDYLRQSALSKVQGAVEEYQFIGPYWFVSQYHGGIVETATQHLWDSPALFAAKAYILKEPYQELAKYLDVPAFARGDLFYIQNLVAAIEAPSSLALTSAPQPMESQP